MCVKMAKGRVKLRKGGEGEESLILKAIWRKNLFTLITYRCTNTPAPADKESFACFMGLRPIVCVIISTSKPLAHDQPN